MQPMPTYPLILYLIHICSNRLSSLIPMFLVRENTKLCLLYAISGMLVVMIQIPGTACMVWYENFTSFFLFCIVTCIYIRAIIQVRLKFHLIQLFVMLYKLINFYWMCILTNLPLYCFFLLSSMLENFLSRLEIIAISFLKYLNFYIKLEFMDD